MTVIFACECKVDTEIDGDLLRRGCVFQCDACRQVWALVVPMESINRLSWIKIPLKEAEDHMLLGGNALRYTQ